MPDNEKDQNDAGDGDDHFLPNRRAIKSCQNIHVTSGRQSSGVCFRLWMRLGASRAVPVQVFLDWWSEELVAVAAATSNRATVEPKSSFTWLRLSI
jgi:hypothetical protein